MAHIYRCDECRKLFRGYSWDDVRFVISEAGIDITTLGEAVIEYAEQRKYLTLCPRCIPL